MPPRRMRPQDSRPRRSARKERRRCADCPGCPPAQPRLAIVAVTAGLIAGFQANLAGERATVAEARRVAALALEEPDFDRALLLAVEAIQLWDRFRDTRQPRTRLLARTPPDEHHPHPGGRSGRREHVARGGRDSSIGDRQRPRCAPVRSRRPIAARRVLAVLQDGGDVGGRPRHWGGRVQRDIRPLYRCSLRLPPNSNARCRRRGPLGREDLRGAGRDGGRRRVLGRRIPVRSARRVDGIRVARARRPLASRRGRPGAPGSGCQRSRSAVRRASSVR